MGASDRGLALAATFPVRLGSRVHQVCQVTLPGAEEEACLVVWVAVIRFVMGEVTTSLVIVTCLGAALETWDGDKIVDGPAPAPAGPQGGCRGGERSYSGQKDGKKKKTFQNLRHLDFVATLLRLSLLAGFTVFKQIGEERLLIPSLLERGPTHGKACDERKMVRQKVFDSFHCCSSLFTIRY